jgi:hypothetical protein
VARYPTPGKYLFKNQKNRSAYGATAVSGKIHALQFRNYLRENVDEVYGADEFLAELIIPTATNRMTTVIAIL